MFYNLLNDSAIKSEDVNMVLENIHQNLKYIVRHQSQSHTFIKHCNKDDEFLQRRILYGNATIATSFYNLKDAISCAEFILEYKWNVIQRFLLTSDEKLVLSYDFHTPIGFGYVKGMPGCYEGLHKIFLILRKDEEESCGFHILTTYPIITEDIVADETIEWNYLENLEVVNEI